MMGYLCHISVTMSSIITYMVLFSRRPTSFRLVLAHLMQPSLAHRVSSAQPSLRHGVNRIAVRTFIAYLIIAAMVSAAIAGITYLRRNNPRRRYHRDRSRRAQNGQSSILGEDAAPDDVTGQPTGRG
jgi:hypothetical protein